MKLSRHGMPSLLRMPQRPDVDRDRIHLLWRELCATHGRHGCAVVLRIRHASRDRLLQTIHAAIAPHPLAGSQIGAQRGAFAVGSMASSARSATGLTVKDLLSE